MHAARSLVRTAVAAGTATVLSLAFAPAVHAATANTMSGTVRAGDAGVPGISVAVINQATDKTVGTTTSGATGAWRVAGLPNGSYIVAFSSNTCAYTTQYYANADTEADATATSLSGGKTAANIDASLLEPSTISGVVNGDDGHPAESTVVTAYRKTSSGWTKAATTSTDDAGAYTLGCLIRGTYTLGFAEGDDRYATEYLGDQTTKDAADTTQITAAGSIVDVDDEELQALSDSHGLAYGKVTDTAGDPVAGVTVTAYAHGQQPGDHDLVTVTTDDSGYYSFPDLSDGTYTLGFTDPTNEYAPGFWTNSDTGSALFSKAAWFTASSDDALAADVQLAAAHTLDVHGDGLAEADVYDADNRLVQAVAADDDGDAPVDGLASGTYHVAYNQGVVAATRSTDHAAGVWDGLIDGTPVSAGTAVVVGASDADLTVAPPSGGTFVGETESGAGCTVEAQGADSVTLAPRTATVDEDGDFEIPGLSTGNYRIALECDDAPTQYLTDGNGTVDDSASAAVYTAVLGQTVTLDDAALDSYLTPQISDTTPATGERLTVSNAAANISSNAIAANTISYQWFVAGVAVSGATGSTFTVPTSALGKTVKVRAVTLVDGSRPAAAFSADTAAVARAIVVKQAAQTVRVGSRAYTGLTVSPSTAKATYQWFWGGDHAITNATHSTLSVVPLQAYGKALTVQVTYTAPGYATTTATYTVSTKVAAGAFTAPTPRISGRAKVGSVLKAAPGTWSPAASLSYQWYSDGHRISGATKSSYRIARSLTGHRITVVVTGRATAYATTSERSARTATVRR